MPTTSFACVRARGADYLLLDELEYYKHIYQTSSVCPNEDLYALKSAFRMRSQIDAQKSAELIGKVPRKRKRSAKRDIDVNPDFIRLCTNLEERFQRIFLDSREKLETPNSNSNRLSCEDDNNEIARSAVSTAESCQHPSNFLNRCACKDGSSMGDYHLTKDTCAINKLPEECVLWSNESDCCLCMEFDQEKFIVPSKSAFVIGDVSLSRHLINRGMIFDLVVIDPPWSNKSVKRKKSYTMFDENELFDIRIPELLCEDGILAVWVTNNDTMKQCVKDVIASFGLVTLSSIHWLKVTTRGEPICGFQPHHKVPFETCILACRQSFFDKYRSTLVSDYLLISTPSAVHSRKPPIKVVLQAMDVIKAGSCLELYGRYLLPHTTTIGLEAVKLQNSQYFKQSSSKNQQC